MTGPRPAALEERAVLYVLREVGFKVSSLAELRQSKTSYPAAVPILVAALSSSTDQNTLMEIARARACPGQSLPPRGL